MTPVQALQAALAGEHAAVYVFSVLGAQTSETEQAALFTRVEAAYDAHRTLRDRLTALIDKHGAAPAGTKAAYELPNDASTPALVQQAARDVEDKVLLVMGQLVESTSGADRAFAISALEATAVRVLGFQGQPSAFPGLEVQP